MPRLLSHALVLAALGIASPAVAGRELTADDVRAVTAAHDEEIKACYLEHALKQRGATGKVTVSVVVERDGSTRDVAVVAPGVKGKALDRCVVDSAMAWRFPPIDQATEVEVPFLFQHTHARHAGARRSSP